MRFRALAVVCGASFCVLASTPLASQTGRRTNVVLFVPDGLRALMVNQQHAPALAALRDRGVNFRNPHSLFPTLTTANASAFATGHYFGDTGNFSNTIFSAFPVPSASGSVTPFLENDAVLGDMDQHFQGNYLGEVTVVRAAREAGLSTAIVGKLGPVLIFDHTDRTGRQTIVIDDSTGAANAIPLNDEITTRLRTAGLPVLAPSRGDNGKTGTSTSAGTLVTNRVQQDYFVDVVTKVVLPMFKARDRPFLLVFWSRDPDGTQHNNGDSLNQLSPGINGPSSLAAIKNADGDLARIQAALTDLGLSETTDVIVSADHGFSTIGKQSQTSTSAKADFDDVPRGFLPPGFLALDLARALGMKVFDPDNAMAPVVPPAFPKRANGLIGTDPANPQVVVAANGGSDLVYLPTRDKALARRVVDVLLTQDYVSGIFVNSAFGKIAGTLPLSALNLEGKAVTPTPSIVVNFRSMSTGCAEPVLCAVDTADTTLQQGQGTHGSLSRADTMNFMAAFGPSFKRGLSDETPASNADVGRTIAHLLGLKMPARGSRVGRVLTDALVGGKSPSYAARTLLSAPGMNGLRTILHYQEVGGTRYFDAAGFPGRTVGLDPAVRPPGT